MTGAERRAAITAEIMERTSITEDMIERLVRGELLEGMDFSDAPAFELWLTLQRTRVHDVIAEALWWIGSRLGTEDPDRALRITERALLFDPFCETTNELLLDLLVPVHDAGVGVLTVVGVALTLVAVGVSGLAARR